MAYENELTVLNTILNFKIPEVSNDTKFWMIRTKKGYFYNEFIGKKFVALAWNSVTCNTDFSEKSRDKPPTHTAPGAFRRLPSRVFNIFRC